MHIVQQFDLLAKLFAAFFEELQGAPNIVSRLEYRAIDETGHGSRAGARAIARHAGHAYLHAHIAEALVHEMASLVDGLLKFGSGSVGVAIGGLATLAPKELIDGHTRLAAFDIPQRLVHAADGIIQHGAVAPIGAVIAGLPDIVDAVGVFTDQKRAQIFFDRGVDQFGALRERSAAVAVQAVLIGSDFDHGEPQAGRRGGDDAYVLDDWRTQSASGLGGLRLGVL